MVSQELLKAPFEAMRVHRGSVESAFGNLSQLAIPLITLIVLEASEGRWLNFHQH